MSKAPTLASVNGATLSGAQQKSFNIALLNALNTLGLQESGRTTITSDTTLAVTQCGMVLVDCTGGDVDLTLPASGDTTDDAAYVICRIDNTANVLSVLKSGSDTIEGAATALTISGKGVLNIQMPADATNWRVIYRNGSTAAGARTAIGAAESGDNSTITRLTGLDLNQFRADVSQLPYVRQTVLDGPVDSNGLPSFGGSTGSATLTASGTIVATSANGSSGDRVGSIANPAFTSPSGNGTAYLYLDINADGTCTPGVTSPQPVYQEGGTYSTTNGQFTFNISEMVGKVGNGSVATQTHRVYIGQCAHTAGVWSGTPTWYALRGRYDSGWTSTLPSAATSVSKNHNLGVTPDEVDFIVENTVSELVFNAEDQASFGSLQTGDGVELRPLPLVKNRLTAVLQTGASTAFIVLNASGVGAVMTAARYKYKITANRGW